LSAHLNLDRRTLQKRLQGLAPVSVETRADGSEVRRYALADVVAHLAAPPRALHDPTDAQIADAASVVYRFVGSELWPKMVGFALPVVTGGFVDELNLSKEQAVRAFQVACLGFALGLIEGAGEHGIELAHPPVLHEFKRLGAAEFCHQHWPESPAES
jgi:hypothetical protein